MDIQSIQGFQQVVGLIQQFLASFPMLSMLVTVSVVFRLAGSLVDMLSTRR